MSKAKEVNLKKLAKSSILMTFIKKNNAIWGHKDWGELLTNLKSRGYSPIDIDQVGLLLESKREAFLLKNAK